MKNIAVFAGLLLVATVASAAITVNTAPTSLVTTATAVGANAEKAVFEFALTGSESETLSSVSVTVNSSTAVSTDLAQVAVYKDDGDGSFDSEDATAGSNTTVNVGSATTINTASNNALSAGGKYFVVLKTAAAGWSGSDSVTVTLNSVATSANSPSITAVTTSSIAADLTGPVLQTVVAMNKEGSTSGLEPGDKVVLTFNEATNKPAITSANIAGALVLNNSHAWLDGVASIGNASWNDAGTVLTVTLSAGTSLPTLAVGDTVTITGSLIKDAAGNNATGSVAITGSFTGSTTTPDDEEDPTAVCAGNIVNGKLYKLAGAQNTTVYLAAGCRLKPFRGAAVFHARGHKFQNIIELSSLSGIQVSDKPALPASGTLIQGSDATVWVVTKGDKKRGFVSEKAFTGLGFRFGAINKISDSDLAMIQTDAAVQENSTHPDGAVVKCGNSPEVFEVRGNAKFPFANAEAFLNRGHSWSHITEVDCGRFVYKTETIVTQ